jgi:hypothetical protein
MDISFKDDVTVILLGVSFLGEKFAWKRALYVTPPLSCKLAGNLARPPLPILTFIFSIPYIVLPMFYRQFFHPYL